MAWQQPWLVLLAITGILNAGQIAGATALAAPKRSPLHQSKLQPNEASPMTAGSHNPTTGTDYR